jgi:hypothetical protein
LLMIRIFSIAGIGLAALVLSVFSEPAAEG